MDFARVGGILSLNFETCLAMFNLCWYGQGFHLQSGALPNLPLNVVQSTFDTLAKLEKWHAALLSSPLMKHKNFMSEGTSSNEKDTCTPETV